MCYSVEHSLALVLTAAEVPLKYPTSGPEFENIVLSEDVGKLDERSFIVRLLCGLKQQGLTVDKRDPRSDYFSRIS